jgi:hypothetical protein
MVAVSRSFKPQIAPAVIVVITVDMLNLTFRKFTSHVQPSEVVPEILSAIDGDDPVSI